MLGVDVRACNASHGDGAVLLLGQVQSIDGIEVGTMRGDMAYSDGDVREAVEETGSEMVAKAPPVITAPAASPSVFDVDTPREKGTSCRLT